MAQLSVRNTFLHFDVDPDNMRGRGTPRSRSVPASDSPRTAPLVPRQEVQLPDMGRPPSAAEIYSGIGKAAAAQSRDGRDDDDDEEGDGDDDDAALLSIGSRAHSSGTCKPCAWNWKPSGCEGGRNCEFCHICGQDELKLRRKRRVRELRASARRNRSSDSGHSSAMSETSSVSAASTHSSRSSAPSRRSGSGGGGSGALGSASRGAVPLPPGPVVRDPSGSSAGLPASPSG